MNKIQTWVNRFLEHSDYEDFLHSVESLKHNVCTCIDEPQTVVHYNGNPNEPVVFTADGQASISLASHGGNQLTMFYSVDNDEWFAWDCSAKSLNDGETLYVRGYNIDGIGKSTSMYSTFSIQGNVSVSGDIMSLVSTIASDVETDYCFYALFSGCTTMTAALSLPSKTTTDGCYMSMFEGCSSMDVTPELHASTLSPHCYDKMFKGCESITDAPMLNATVLEPYCYNEMFEGCTSLSGTPILGARNLVEGCYSSMFDGCLEVSGITCLATSGFETTDCLNNWLQGTESVGNFVKTPGVSWTRGTSGIPNLWVIDNNFSTPEIIDIDI